MSSKITTERLAQAYDKLMKSIERLEQSKELIHEKMLHEKEEIRKCQNKNCNKDRTYGNLLLLLPILLMFIIYLFIQLGINISQMDVNVPGIILFIWVFSWILAWFAFDVANNCEKLRDYCIAFHNCKYTLFETCLINVIENIGSLKNALHEFMVDGSMKGIMEFVDKYSSNKCPWYCDYGGYNVIRYKWVSPFKWVSEFWNAVYLNSVESLRKLVYEIEDKLISEDYRGALEIKVSDNFTCDFYLRFLEYHYMLAKSILSEYEEHEAKTHAIPMIKETVTSKPSSVSVNQEGWNNILYEGLCEFKFGSISGWRSGTIKVTGKGVIIEGKLKLDWKMGNIAVLAITAAARAAGIGEVFEKISYDNIRFYRYHPGQKKIVIETYNKQYIIKTDAASYIGKLLDKYAKT